MKTVKRLQAIGLAFVGVLLVTSLCAAQVSTSSITGTVVDKQGLVVVGAKVVAKNEATGVTYDTSTTSAGDYTLSALPPGQYTITVTHTGFRTFASVHNALTVGTPLVVDAKLDIGQMSEVVQVESSYARVETTNAMVSDVVTRREVVELPLNGGNPLGLITLEPGLVQRTNNAAGSGTHVFGSRDRAHNVTIDGIDSNESSVPNPQSNINRLSRDNVQEYRVVTHDATPEYGRNSGANVAVATRGGTNELHGGASWFHRNTVLNANEWFNNATGVPRPPLLLNQWGGDISGPIIKSKTFFFFSYQGNHISLAEPLSQTFGVPLLYTQTMRNGIFRYVKGTVNGQNANSPQLVDANGNLLPGVPVCATSSSTNCVASYNIFSPTNNTGNVPADPKTAALIGSLPLPNNFSAGDGLNFAGFAWNPPSVFDGPFFMFRVDHKFNDNNNVFVRYLHSSYDTTQGDLLNARPILYPGFPPMGEVFRNGRNLAMSYRRVISPTVVNDFTAGFNRFRFRFTFGESNPNFGDPTKVPPYGQRCAGTKSFRNIDTPFCDTPHTQRAVSTVQFIDNLSIVHGAHTIRTGINFRFYRHNDSRGLAGGQNLGSNVIFDQSIRSQPSSFVLPSGIDPNTDLLALENAIVEQTGLPAEIDQAFAADFRADSFPGSLQVIGTRAKQYDSYVQDEWRIRPNLALTYGVRWELNVPPTDCCDRVLVPNQRVDGSQGTVSFGPDSSWFRRGNKNAFAPRISFAWKPRGEKTVVRAGYGIAFDTISTFQVTSIGGQVPGAALFCRQKVGVAITFGCIAPANLDKSVAGGFPLTLPPPSLKPSQTFTPPAQAFLTAPNVAAFDPNLKVPTVHEWNLTIQRELPKGFVAQVGYIGKRGMRLYRAYDLNQIRTDQPGFLQSFLIAQQNIFNGCKPDGTSCPAGITGVAPTLLVQLAGASFINNSTSQSNFRLNGLGELARRIDQLRFSTFTGNAFPASYFRPNPQFSQIFYFDSGGDSYYHGLIVQLRRRFEKGLTMGLSYTLAKSIDDMSVDPVGASSGGALSGTNSRTPTDIRNFRLDRTRSDFDDRHAIVADTLYELPFGRGRTWGSNWPGYVNQVLGGWTVTGIFTYLSGEPFSIISGVRTANGFKVSQASLHGPFPSTDLQNASGITGPVEFPTGSLINNPTDPNFNCRQVTGTQSFFCIPPPGGQGLARNSGQGPGFWNLDFGVIKGFRLTERVGMQFRAEFFNVFNHANFENPRNSTTADSNDRAANNLRSTVFGQACCVTSSLPSSATVNANGEPNRVIQFALKISF